jgi:hypothetical protein
MNGGFPLVGLAADGMVLVPGVTGPQTPVG